MSRLSASLLILVALALIAMNLLVLSVHTNAPICTDSIPPQTWEVETPPWPNRQRQPPQKG